MLRCQPCKPYEEDIAHDVYKLGKLAPPTPQAPSTTAAATQGSVAYEKVPGTRDMRCRDSITVGNDASITLDRCAAMVASQARCGDYFAWYVNHAFTNP